MSIVFDSAMRARATETIVKSHATARAATIAEKRLTLAPVFSPNRKDAHREWTTPEALEDAVIEFSKSGNKRLFLQHGDLGNHHVGDILAVFTWPFEVTCDMTTPRDGKVRKMTFEPHTAWLWAQWDKGKAWESVKNGTLQGYSLGGRALRVPTPGVTLPDMGDMNLAKAGRVLSAKNAAHLRACIATIEGIISRDPTAAAQRGMAKSGDGVLIVNEADQVVYHLTDDAIEVLG
jgi:hypothetical protein